MSQQTENTTILQMTPQTTTNDNKLPLTFDNDPIDYHNQQYNL